MAGGGSVTVPKPTQPPFPSLEERWNDFSGTPNWVMSGWTINPGAAGIVTATPAAGANARATAIQDFSIVPFALFPPAGVSLAFQLYYRLHIEFEINTVLTPGNINDGETFMGLTNGNADTRSTATGLIGFGFDSSKKIVGVIKDTALTQHTYGPVASASGPLLPYRFSKYGLDIRQNVVDFYYNDQKFATQVLVAGGVSILPLARYLVFYLQSIGGASGMALGYVRAWYSALYP